MSGNNGESSEQRRNQSKPPITTTQAAPIIRRTLNILATASKLCPTSNPELCRGAAEGAGERRGDVGSDYLFGRFFWRGFFTGWPADAGWRIDQAAVLKDFFDLRAVQGLVLEQRFGDGFECVAIRNERVLGQLIGVVDEPAHFLVDLFGSRFAVIARTRNVATEENVIFVLAVFDHPHFLAHAPFANHATRNGGGASDVAARAVGDVAKDDFFRDPAAHGDCETGQQFV